MPFAGVVTRQSSQPPPFLLFLILWASPLCHGAGNHNITAILATIPDFAEFNAALNSTGLAAEIDNRTTITVLAVDNAVMAAPGAAPPAGYPPSRALSARPLRLLQRCQGPPPLRRLLARHQPLPVLRPRAEKRRRREYHGAPRRARGVRAVRRRRCAPTVFYQKSIHESPYDIAVLQVNALMSSLAVEEQAPAPPGLTDLMSKNGCGGFASLVTATADAAEAYQKSVDGGLTIFCQADKAVAALNPTFKNLTADGQLALLLYHGVVTHYPEKALKSINGEVNTLATDGAKSFNLTIRDGGDTVKLS